jgi:hypothetical protein
VVVVAADVVVVFGVVVRDSATAGTAVRFVGPGTVAPGAAVEPVLLMLPVAGVVVVAGVAGSVVRGVGTGGNGFDMTLAIRSVRPASDWLWRNL